MLSMTGFGQATGEMGGHRVSVVLRSVNHRYLDLSLRLPDLCLRSEAALQRLLGEHLTRGRVEVTVEIEAIEAGEPRLQLRTEVARAVVEAVDDLRSQGLVEGEVTAGDLLQMPGFVDIRVPEEVWTDEDEAFLLDVAGEALEEMAEARRVEGRHLAEVIRQKVERFAERVDELEALRPQAQHALTEAFRARLDELLHDCEIDAARLEQEVAVLIDRSNVSEELERLMAHLKHFRQIVERSGAVGKQLDFVVQEIFRELNTLSAKCRSAAMTKRAVEAKVLCQELREQLRNVE